MPKHKNMDTTSLHRYSLSLASSDKTLADVRNPDHEDMDSEQVPVFACGIRHHRINEVFDANAQGD